MTIKVLLVDDHAILREGLRLQIEKLGQMQVVAEAGDGREAVRLARETQPDLIVMDVSLPGLNGFDATRQILSERPEVHIIALSMHKNPKYVARMLKAGARAYVLKESAFSEIASAISWVAKGKVFLSPLVADVVLNGFLHAEKTADSSALDILSPREREIMQLIAEGNSNRKIAGKLNLSVRTIETHRKNLMEKLNLRDISQLVVLAVREGLINVD